MKEKCEKCRGCEWSSGCGFMQEEVQDYCPCGECLVKVNCSMSCTERNIRYVAYVVFGKRDDNNSKEYLKQL